MAGNRWIKSDNKSNESGGFIKFSGYENQPEEIAQSSNGLFCGWNCESSSKWVENYEEFRYFYNSLSWTSFTRFEIPTIAGTISDVTLFLRLNYSLFLGAGLSDEIYADVYTTHDAVSEVSFPKNPVSSSDYSDLGSDNQPIWTFAGSLGTMKDVGVGTWKNVSVRTAYQAAVAAGATYFGVKIKASTVAPSNWNPTDYGATSVDHAFVAFCGAATTEFGNAPDSYGSDTGQTNIYQTPLLKVAFSDVTPPPTPDGAIVNCVAADVLAKVCLAGTQSGRLWKIWHDGTEWHKDIVGVSLPITAVCIDKIINFRDYTSPLVYFGNSEGSVYKSDIAAPPLNGWFMLPQDFGAPIKAIRTGDLDVNKIVIGAGNTLFYSRNGADGSWETLTETTEFKDVCIYGDEIQVVFDGAKVYRSPNFGKDWFSCYGVPSTASAICFNPSNHQQSLILTDGTLYKYSTGDGQFQYVNAQSTSGIGKKLKSGIMTPNTYIGTSTSLYVTNDWGQSIYLLKSLPVTDLAIGGIKLVEE